ncbi:MAG: transcriptional regulator, partial [Pseudomonadota bacterium]
MRGDQIVRQWKILRRLEAAGPAGLTAAEVAAEGGMSPRTAYRDLEDLQAAGFPIYQEKTDKGSCWMLLDSFRCKLPAPFTLTEVLSLQCSEELFQVFRGTLFHEALVDLLEKIRASLPPETIQFLNRLKSVYRMGRAAGKDYGRFREVIAQLNAAATDQRTIEIAYQALKSTERTVRCIDPYRIWFYDGTFYLIGKCHMRGEVRTFVLDRISMLRVTDDKFQIPADFDFDAYTRSSFKVMKDDLYTVRIRISPAWARWVEERTWHESQRIQKQFDGGIEIIFRVAGMDEIRQWVLSLGPEAVVVDPWELRELVQLSLAETLSKYG